MSTRPSKRLRTGPTILDIFPTEILCLIVQETYNTDARNFMHLPVEIRLLIYKNLAKKEIFNLIRVCWKIYDEAKHLLILENEQFQLVLGPFKAISFRQSGISPGHAPDTYLPSIEHLPIYTNRMNHLILLCDISIGFPFKTYHHIREAKGKFPMSLESLEITFFISGSYDVPGSDENLRLTLEKAAQNCLTELLPLTVSKTLRIDPKIGTSKLNKIFAREICQKMSESCSEIIEWTSGINQWIGYHN